MRTLMVEGQTVGPHGGRLKALVRNKLDPRGARVIGPEEVERYLPTEQPELVLVLLSPEIDQALRSVRSARRIFAGPILAVGPVSDPRLILRALHEGADHYLDEANLEQDFDATIARFQHREEACSPTGRAASILSASGGCGASTIAVNVATTLARDHGQCGLLDLKVGRGDLAAMLDLKPSFSLADVSLNAARMDLGMFEKVLARSADGVHLLGSPQAYGATRVVTPYGVSQALAMGRTLFTHLLADLEDCFHEEQVVTLRQSCVILIVTRLEFNCLRNLRRVLEQLRSLDVGEDRIRIGANRYGQPGELAAREAEDALECSLSYFIPDDPKVVNTSNNMGIPAVVKYPASRFSQAIVKMGRDLMDRRKSPALTGACAPSSH